MFYALLIAITVQSIGLLILKNLNIIEVPAETFPVIGTILGSFVFGIGIVLAGGCATGTWYRAGVRVNWKLGGINILCIDFSRN